MFNIQGFESKFSVPLFWLVLQKLDGRKYAEKRIRDIWSLRTYFRILKTRP